MPPDPANPQPAAQPQPTPTPTPQPAAEPVVLGTAPEPLNPSTPNLADNAAPPSGSSGSAQPANPAPGDPASTPPAAPPKQNLIKKLLSRTSIYGWIFLAGLILVGLIVATVVLQAKKSNSPATTGNVASLTDKQIAELKGNATVVGNSKQTLDIQSSTIFDSQVLLRNDLNVAGAIKAGGAGTFQSITIGGTGDFSDVHINNSLGVVNDSNLQGNLTVHKDLVVNGSSTLGTVSISQLTVGGLNFNGDFQVNKHITTNGSIPTRSSGPAVGGGGTTSLSGTDTAGTVIANIGSSPTNGVLVNITFTTKFASTPHVVVSPSSSSAAGLAYYVTKSTSGFSISLTNTPNPGTVLSFDYIVID